MSTSLYEMLREDLCDETDLGVSTCAVRIDYRDGTVQRTVIGFPYEAASGELAVGPYANDKGTGVPSDYEARKIRIPIRAIQGYEVLDEIRAQVALNWDPPRKPKF